MSSGEASWIFSAWLSSTPTWPLSFRCRSILCWSGNWTLIVFWLFCTWARWVCWSRGGIIIEALRTSSLCWALIAFSSLFLVPNFCRKMRSLAGWSPWTKCTCCANAPGRGIFLVLWLFVFFPAGPLNDLAHRCLCSAAADWSCPFWYLTLHNQAAPRIRPQWVSSFSKLLDYPCGHCVALSHVWFLAPVCARFIFASSRTFSTWCNLQHTGECPNRVAALL